MFELATPASHGFGGFVSASRDLPLSAPCQAGRAAERQSTGRTAGPGCKSFAALPCPRARSVFDALGLRSPCFYFMCSIKLSINFCTMTLAELNSSITHFFYHYY